MSSHKFACDILEQLDVESKINNIEQLIVNISKFFSLEISKFVGDNLINLQQVFEKIKLFLNASARPQWIRFNGNQVKKPFTFHRLLTMISKVDIHTIEIPIVANGRLDFNNLFPWLLDDDQTLDRSVWEKIIKDCQDEIQINKKKAEDLSVEIFSRINSTLSAKEVEYYSNQIPGTREQLLPLLKNKIDRSLSSKFRKIVETAANKQIPVITGWKTFGTIYHRESLIAHSIMSMIIAIANANHQKLTLRETIEQGICALLHDIGKLATLSMQTNEQLGSYTSYPCHGEFTALICRSFYDEKTMDNLISVKTWDNLCTIWEHHMCGYHGVKFDDPFSEYKLGLLSRLNQQILKQLCNLSIADTYACIPESAFSWTFVEFQASREVFLSKVGANHALEMMHKTLVDGQGALINLIGTSNMGKSTVGKFIVNKLKQYGVNKVSLYERDVAMCEIYCRKLNIPFNGIRYTGKEYNAMITYISKNKLSGEVDTLIRIKSTEDLSNGYVVILDTMAHWFQTGQDKLIPGTPVDSLGTQLTTNALKLTVWVEGNCEINTAMADKNGVDLIKQMDLSGNRFGLISTIPVTIRSDVDLSIEHLAPISTKANPYMFQQLQELVATPSWKPIVRAQPHISRTISWDVDRTSGLESLADELSFVAKWIDSKQISDTNKMTVTELFTYLVKKFKLPPDDITYIDKLRKWFRLRKFFCTALYKGTPFYGKVFIINYIEGICTTWNTKWSRTCRGLILALDDQGKAFIIKRLLQRGAEVLSGFLSAAGVVETQEMSFDANGFIKTANRFDHAQRYMINLLKYTNEQEVKSEDEVYLTSKLRDYRPRPPRPAGGGEHGVARHGVQRPEPLFSLQPSRPFVGFIVLTDYAAVPATAAAVGRPRAGHGGGGGKLPPRPAG